MNFTKVIFRGYNIIKHNAHAFLSNKTKRRNYASLILYESKKVVIARPVLVEMSDNFEMLLARSICSR